MNEKDFRHIISEELDSRLEPIESKLESIDGRLGFLEKQLDFISEKLIANFALVLEDTGLIKQQLRKELGDLGISVEVLVKVVDSMGTATVTFDSGETQHQMKVSEIISSVKSRIREVAA